MKGQFTQDSGYSLFLLSSQGFPTRKGSEMFSVLHERFTYSSTNLLIYSSIYLFIHSLIYLSTHSPNGSLIPSFLPSFLPSFTHSLSYSHVHVHRHSLFHLSVIHASIHPSTICLSTHPSIQPSLKHRPRFPHKAARASQSPFSPTFTATSTYIPREGGHRTRGTQVFSLPVVQFRSLGTRLGRRGQSVTSAAPVCT